MKKRLDWKQIVGDIIGIAFVAALGASGGYIQSKFNSPVVPTTTTSVVKSTVMELKEPRAEQFRVSYYQAHANNKTALGDTPLPGKHVAVSPDRLDLLGETVYVYCPNGPRVGVREVRDLTDVKIKNTVDIMVPKTMDPDVLGVQECLVKVIPTQRSR